MTKNVTGTGYSVTGDIQSKYGVIPLNCTNSVVPTPMPPPVNLPTSTVKPTPMPAPINLPTITVKPTPIPAPINLPTSTVKPIPKPAPIPARMPAPMNLPTALNVPIPSGSLTINNSTYVITQNITISGDVTIQSGVLIVTNSSQATIKGNLIAQNSTIDLGSNTGITLHDANVRDSQVFISPTSDIFLGCANFTGSILIVKADTTPYSTYVIHSNQNCTQPFSQVQINGSTISNPCLQAKQDLGDQGLYVTFEVQQCEEQPMAMEIIVPCIIGAIIVLCIIVILLAEKNKQIRNIVFPFRGYSKKRVDHH